MTIADLEKEALALDAPQRAQLAERLLESLDELSEREVERLWFEEAERRSRALDRGELESIPAEVVLREARNALR
jgi:Putative addiction module component